MTVIEFIKVFVFASIPLIAWFPGYYDIQEKFKNGEIRTKSGRDAKIFFHALFVLSVYATIGILLFGISYNTD